MSISISLVLFTCVEEKTVLINLESDIDNKAKNQLLEAKALNRRRPLSSFEVLCLYPGSWDLGYLLLVVLCRKNLSSYSPPSYIF